MARLATGFSLEDYVLNQLKCPSCTKYMRPPIYRCPSEHPVCKECWEEKDRCAGCDESYVKELKQDAFKGFKVYDYPCPRNCGSVVVFNGQWSPSFHRLSGSIDDPYEFKCGNCATMSGKLYRCNGTLLTEDEFHEINAKFKPQRMLHLERFAELVEYQCEMEGCTKFASLAELEIHVADCVCRCVECPLDDCKWKGPVHSLVEHITDSTVHPNCASFDPKEEKPLLLEFIFPSVFAVDIVEKVGDATDGIDDAIGANDEDVNSIEEARAFLYKGKVSAVIEVTISWLEEEEDPLELYVGHIGLKSVSDSLICKLRLKSKLSEESLVLHCATQNDTDDGKWIHLWRLSHLEERGFVERDDKNWKIVLEVIVQEKKSATDLLPAALGRVSITESVD